jgi:hypothetical protein
VAGVRGLELGNVGLIECRANPLVCQNIFVPETFRRSGGDTPIDQPQLIAAFSWCPSLCREQIVEPADAEVITHPELIAVVNDRSARQREHQAVGEFKAASVAVEHGRKSPPDAAIVEMSLWACGQRTCVVHHVHSDGDALASWWQLPCPSVIGLTDEALTMPPIVRPCLCPRKGG